MFEIQTSQTLGYWFSTFFLIIIIIVIMTKNKKTKNVLILLKAELNCQISTCRQLMYRYVA